MLVYKHVKNLFQSSKGIQDETLPFLTVFVDSNVYVSKGLYIPIINKATDEKKAKEFLSEAITHGAIAAIWPLELPLPQLVPNHFPVFFVQETLDALNRLVTYYVEKTNETSFEVQTKFVLPRTDNHNEKNCTYDSPVIAILKELENKLANSSQNKEEGGNSHA